MAAILPTDLFPGLEYVAAAGTVTADSVAIPLSVLTELTEAEADPATGDGAQLIRAIDKAASDALTALTQLERPTNMLFATATNTTGTNTREITYSRTYFETAPAQVFDLTPEA